MQEYGRVGKEVEMERKSIFKYYSFGINMHHLLNVKPGWKIHKNPGRILANVKSFLSHINNLPLPVTTRALKKLKHIEKVSSNADKDISLSEKDASRVCKIMGEIRIALEAELKGIEVFSITPKIIDVNKLIDDVPSLFFPGIFNILPKYSIYDFSEAGKCIAFNRPTAAAFHILRGTEALLRHFYTLFIRRNRIPVLMWGNMIADLRNRQKTKKYETLYIHLDHIREAFRNPTQHPDKIYNIHEAQELWNLCVDAVNRMGKILVEVGYKSF